MTCDRLTLEAADTRHKKPVTTTYVRTFTSPHSLPPLQFQHILQHTTHHDSPTSHSLPPSRLGLTYPLPPTATLTDDVVVIVHGPWLGDVLVVAHLQASYSGLDVRVEHNRLTILKPSVILRTEKGVGVGEWTRESHLNCETCSPRATCKTPRQQNTNNTSPHRCTLLTLHILATLEYILCMCGST